MVAVLDADKEGFLRSERSLIQTIGRAARHLNGTAIMYGDNTTKSMEKAIDETERRRKKQLAYNKKYDIKPRGVTKKIQNLIDTSSDEVDIDDPVNSEINEVMVSIKTDKQLMQQVVKLEKKMRDAAKNLDFENAAVLRDQLRVLRKVSLK